MPAQPGPRPDQIQPSPGSNPGDIMTIGLDNKPTFIPPASTASFTGQITMFGGPYVNIPNGYLACDGSEVSRSTYSDLFSVISTSWGAGDGSTTFNLPDFRGKSPLGLNDGTLPSGANVGLTTRMLADTGGEEDHILTIGEMPAHTHQSDTRRDAPGGVYLSSVLDANHSAAGATSTALDLGATPTGGDTPHNTMHPFSVCLFIIKT